MKSEPVQFYQAFMHGMFVAVLQERTTNIAIFENISLISISCIIRKLNLLKCCPYTWELIFNYYIISERGKASQASTRVSFNEVNPKQTQPGI